eukprot:11850818-Alexandrium_andersonii.AAC.1
MPKALKKALGKKHVQDVPKASGPSNSNSEASMPIVHRTSSSSSSMPQQPPKRSDLLWDEAAKMGELANAAETEGRTAAAYHYFAVASELLQSSMEASAEERKEAGTAA